MLKSGCIRRSSRKIVRSFSQQAVASDRTIPTQSLDPKLVWQRKLFDWVGSQIGIKQPDDWYKVTPNTLKQYQASKLLRGFDSLHHALSVVYSEHQWLPWKFNSTPHAFWQSHSTRRQFFEQAQKQLGLNSLDDWYNVKAQDMHQLEDSSLGLLALFKNSLPYALMDTFPEHNWIPWKFQTIPKNYWISRENRKKFMKWAAEQLGLKELSDWYQVKTSQIVELGGESLLSKYNHSIYHLLADTYPEVKWFGYKLLKTPIKYWDSPEHVAPFLQELSERLHIKNLDEWYRVSQVQLQEAGALTLIKQYGGLHKILKKFYPQHNWDLTKFTQQPQKRAAQRWLRIIVSQIFPNREIFEDCLHSKLLFPHTQREMQLDIFVPSLDLALEYQGQQHYIDISHFAPQRTYGDRDAMKRQACQRERITLVEVPYWWDRMRQSLIATLLKIRPDLKEAMSEEVKALIGPLMKAIPDEPPAKAQPQSRADTSVSNLLMHATEWKEDMNPSGWLMSEKLDGVRVYWNPATKILYARTGRPISGVPDSWKSTLPDISIDGELWLGRGKGDELMAIIKAKKKADSWNNINLFVIDAPQLQGNLESRLSQLNKIQSSWNQNVQLISHVICKDKNHFEEFKKSVLSQGGEGVVMRNPNSAYESGRSPNFLKWKQYFDAEVKFLKLSHQGIALVCQQSNGKQVIVRCPTEAYNKPPKPGTVITVQHEGVFDTGTLKYPYFVRERFDVEFKVNKNIG